MHNSRSIAATLDILMERKGLSDNELYRLTDVAQPTISRIRTGKRPNPRSGTIKPLADYFNVTLAQLRGEDPLPWESDKADPYAPTERLKSIDENILAVALSYVVVEWWGLPYDGDEIQEVASLIAEGYTRMQLAEQDRDTIHEILSAAIKKSRGRDERTHKGEHESNKREADHG